MIHKEGYLYLIVSFILSIVVLVLSNLFFSKALFGFICIVVLVMLILVIQFFRNPKRTIDELNDQYIYAPADGKVVVIEEIMETEYYNEKRKQVSIFMSPLNVHVNRAPFSGVTKFVKYHKGKYLAAWNPKASTENERTTIVLENKYGDVLLRQIAGALARRIK